MTARAGWLRAAAQVILIGGAVAFLAQTARQHWSTLGSVRVTLSWPPLLLASALVLLAFALMVQTWVVSLRWWGQRLDYRSGLRIWSLSNLARFIPGAVWQFAGLAALSMEARISPVAATGAILFQQVVLLATGIVVTALSAPAMLGAWTARLSTPALMATLLLSLAGLVVVVSRLAPLAARGAARLFRRPITVPVPPAAGLGVYTAVLVLPWIAYGFAFWLFGRAILGVGAPSLPVAAGSFVASYVAGILAVFAPAGLGVREGALVLLLEPHLGGERSLVLSLSSRLWLIVVEILGAAIVALTVRRSHAVLPEPRS